MAAAKIDTYLLWHLLTDQHACELLHEILLSNLLVEWCTASIHEHIDSSKCKIDSLHLL